MTTSNPAKEITEYNKLGICMKEFAINFGMACGCKKCMDEVLLTLTDNI